MPLVLDALTPLDSAVLALPAALNALAGRTRALSQSGVLAEVLDAD